ncbi:unnamed protein product [Fusarium venenatum]|uniref:Uncharacterized protein n=1 Tax=Fusarium venenatum TaxID=56646 RepID=A0A2L2STF1_9HYPO|nr:uncharacterized protein FVRRES_13312 [Fusarium venenatum]CEI40866.1 unnamed protein product [Fusarium venenatum]
MPTNQSTFYYHMAPTGSNAQPNYPSSTADHPIMSIEPLLSRDILSNIHFIVPVLHKVSFSTSKFAKFLTSTRLFDIVTYIKGGSLNILGATAPTYTEFEVSQHVVLKI